MIRGNFLALGICALIFQQGITATADDQPKEDLSVSARQELKDDSANVRKYGLYASVGNPYPTLLGINAAYNMSPSIRVSVGYGEVEVTSSLSFNGTSFVEETVSAKTYSAGAEYLFLQTPVRAVVGLRAGYFDVSGKGEIEINGFEKSTGYLYTNAGIDWINQNGYQLGAGINLALAGASSAGLYVNSGYFF